MISLRDGRKLIGVLRSWDQYGMNVLLLKYLYETAYRSLLTCFFETANLVLQDTVERIFVQEYYADIPRGVFLVRGENVLLLGEIVLPHRHSIDSTVMSGNIYTDGLYRLGPRQR